MKKILKSGAISRIYIFSLMGLFLIGGIGYYCWRVYAKYHGGIPERKPETTQGETSNIDDSEERRFALKMISPEEIKKTREEILSQVDMNEEQKERIRGMTLPQSREEVVQRLKELNEFLTPEQIQQFRHVLRKTIDSRIEEVMKRLEPEDREDLRKRIERRRQQMGVLEAATPPSNH